MEPLHYIRILRRRWRMAVVVILVSLAGLGAGIAQTLLATPVFQSQTELFVSTQGGADVSQLLEGSSFTQQRVMSYATIVTSPIVLQPVINELNLTTTPQTLASAVTADAPAGTVLINISVNDTSALRAQQIASAIATTFSKVVMRLEKPSGPGVTPVKISVVSAANLPTTPISPNRTVNMARGFILGLMLGVGALALREALDTSVKGRHDIEQITDASIIGEIPYDQNVSRQPLLTEMMAQSPRFEAMRQVRTNLQFLGVANRSRSLVFTSSLPGEGKTLTSINLALVLAAAGLRTCLIEGDLRRPQIVRYLGLEGAIGLTSVLIGRAELDDVLQPWGSSTNLDVLPSGPIPPNPSELLGSSAMEQLIGELEQRYDYVIIDAPPLLPVTDASVLAKLAAGAVVVVASGRIKRDQLDQALTNLGTVNAPILGIVLNFMPQSAKPSYGYSLYGYGEAQDETTQKRPVARRRDKARL